MTILLIFLIFTGSAVFAKDFSQEDKERLIRLEEGLKAVNQRIDSLDKRIDDLKNLMYVLIGAVFAQTIGVVGFVLWDRGGTPKSLQLFGDPCRTALQPALRKNKELEERQDRIERTLRELAKIDKKVEEVLKNTGLL
ncbi:hypothetical protein [Thermodesulfovibrio sp. TK110]